MNGRTRRSRSPPQAKTPRRTPNKDDLNLQLVMRPRQGWRYLSTTELLARGHVCEDLRRWSDAFIRQGRLRRFSGGAVLRRAEKCGAGLAWAPSN